MSKPTILSVTLRSFRWSGALVYNYKFIALRFLATAAGGFCMPVTQRQRRHAQPTEKALLLPACSVFDLIFSQF